jgi:DNA-binding FadR family transcriptional regulator
LRSRWLDREKAGRRKRTSHAQVVDELGKAIVSGAFPVGSILPGDSELADRFKVSRTVLRESMKTLTAKGLVFPRARVGTKVTEKDSWNMFDSEVLTWHFDSGVDQAFLLHLYDVRLAFEPVAASLAARSADADEVEMLRELAMEMAAPDHTTDGIVLSDLRFHLMIGKASHNPFMRTLGSLIEAALVGMFRMSTPQSEGGHGNIAATHMRIVDAIAAGDGPGARKAMENVILEGRERILAGFQAAEHR